MNLFSRRCVIVVSVVLSACSPGELSSSSDDRGLSTDAGGFKSSQASVDGEAGVGDQGDHDDSGDVGAATFCESYYGGVRFDGFCFTDFESTVALDEFRAEGGVLRYTPRDSHVERTVQYPPSIKVKDFGVSFTITFTLTNSGTETEVVKLHGFNMYVREMEDIDFDQEIEVAPNQTKEVLVPVDLPGRDARRGVNRYVYYRDGKDALYLSRIIFYWDYNPFSEQEAPILTCGHRSYNKDQGVCIDGILYPAINEFACNSDQDCLAYDDQVADFRCYEHSCLVMSGTYGMGSKDRAHRVGILPLYVTDNDSTFSNMVEQVDERLGEIIPLMKKWFAGEKTHWNVVDDFQFDFFKVEGDCRMSHAELSALPEDANEDKLRQIEKRCVSNKNYDILVISVQRDDFFPNFEGAGICHGSIISAALGPRVILHELLHGFGEHDLYGVEPYQWGNCHLYNVNTGGDWEQELPHLCKFEVMQLGWVAKYPL